MEEELNINPESEIRKQNRLMTEYGYNNPYNPVAPVPQPFSMGNNVQPRLDPDTQKKRNENEIPNIVGNIRGIAKTTFYQDRAAMAPFSERIKETVNRNDATYQATRPGVKISDVYDRLNDGTWIPKFKNFVYGTDNEDRLARSQGVFNKWFNGLAKAVVKTGVYGVSGAIKPFLDIYNVAKEGNFNAIYNNDYLKHIDDIDTRMNHMFPNYYRREERDYNFLRSLGTANFWANDFLGGASFTAGAIVTELLWGAATGGASLAGTGARAAYRAASQGAAKQFSRSAARGARSYLADPKSHLNSYLRQSTLGGGVLGAVNNARFIATSSGWESSIEAFHFMKEAEINFMNDYEARNGRAPSQNELNEFKAEAINAGNVVFAANMGIVGSSNILMFGQYFGVGTKILPSIEKGINRGVWGLGVERIPGEIGKFRRITPTKFQKGAATTFNVLKRPFTEGVWEEGGQGVASNTALSYIQSKFDPDAESENASLLESLKDGFKESYGTREGFKEIGIGAIIGGLFGVRSGFGVREYSQQSKRIDALVDSYNNNNDRISTSAINTIKRSLALNQQLAASRRADEAIENGDINVGKRELEMSLLSKFQIEDELGLLDDTRTNFKSILDNINNEDLARDLNIPSDQVSSYKSKILDDFDSKLADYRDASKIADTLVPDDTSLNYRDYVLANVYLGSRARKNLNELASDIQEATNIQGFGDAVSYYSSLDAEQRQLGSELANLEDELVGISQEIERLKTSITSEGQTADLDNRLSRRAEVVKRLTEVNKLLQTKPGGDINFANLAGEENTAPGASTISTSFRTLRAFDEYLNVLRNTDRVKADLLQGLIDEYRSNLVDYRSVNEMILRLRDQRFMRNEARGLARVFNSFGEQYIEDQESYEDIVEGGVSRLGLVYGNDAAIDAAYENGDISEDEAFTFKAYNHMKDRFQRGDLLDSNNQIEDRISNEIFDNFQNNIVEGETLQGIADHIYESGLSDLSDREKQIYNKYKSDIDGLRMARGDNPLTIIDKLRKKLNKITNRNIPISERNQDIIDGVIEEVRKSNGDRAVEDLLKSINNYETLSDARDTGSPIVQENLEDAISDINEAGLIGGVSNILDFIEQNRLIKRGINKIGSVVQRTPASDVITDDMPKSGNNRTIENTQNNNTLMMRKTRSGRWEISGLRPERLVSIIPHILKNTNSNGDIILELASGKKVTISPSDKHASSYITDVDARTITNETNIILTKQSGLYTSRWLPVYMRDGTRVVPVPTGVGYGRNEIDVINDENVLNVKEGESVRLQIDLDDTYNQNLKQEVESARERALEATNELSELGRSGADESLIDAARQRSRDADRFYNQAMKNAERGVVIKVIHNDNFVSVIKGLTDDAKESNPSIQKLKELREKAYKSYMSDSRTSGTIEINGSFDVSLTHPGRPNINIVENEQGDLQVQELDFTEETKQNVLTIGYMLNGDVILKDSSVKYNIYPFLTKAEREGRKPTGQYYGQKVPVVAIRHSNGKNYLYPVSLKNQSVVNTTNEMISLLDELISNPANIDAATIQKLNAFSSSLNLNPNDYQIQIAGYVEDVISSMEKLRDELTRVSTLPNVDLWLTDTRTSQDIAQDDTTINIDLSNNPFYSPKIVLNILEVKDTKSAINDIDIDLTDLPFPIEGVSKPVVNTEIRGRTIHLSGQPNIVDISNVYNNTSQVVVSMDGLSEAARDIIMSNANKSVSKLNNMYQIGNTSWYRINSKQGKSIMEIYNINTGETARLQHTGTGTLASIGSVEVDDWIRANKNSEINIKIQNALRSSSVNSQRNEQNRDC